MKIVPYKQLNLKMVELFFMKYLTGINLSELKNKHDHLQICFADLSQHEAPNTILEASKNISHFDILINNAGVYLGDDTTEDFSKSFLINSSMPYFLFMALKTKLRVAKNPICAQISSTMGSITENTSGGFHSYRASKAALNMIFKSVAIDHDWLTVLQLHPGWMKTKMGGDNAPVSPATSANGLWKIISSANHSHSGSFLDYQGRHIPW